MEAKRVIITGSGAGIGKEAALMFAKEGAMVAVNSISESAKDVFEEIVSAGGKAIFVQADVSTTEGAQKLVNEATAAFGGVDILVNNAGIVPEGSVETTTEDEWDHAMAVNVKSVYLVSRYCMSHLRQSKGCIINTSSALALKGVAGRAAYAATKGAVLSLSRSMAKEYVGEGIRVNCVSPGTVMTPSFEKRVQNAPDPKQAMKDFISRQPLGRLCSTYEAASAILYLASDKAGFMTGSNILLDGGLCM